MATEFDPDARGDRRRGPSPVIVGIGASAGGIAALQTLLAALPGDSGASYVVILHLDPKTPSDLSGILSARTSMRVIQVVEPQRLQANTVYVIPPDRRLNLSDHEISAEEFAEPRGRRAPIDLFFRSLAQHGDGFAIILTGAGSDGAIGIKAVKEAGGIIVVQDPDEAEFSSMPRSAIATGIADFVLPLRDIAARLPQLIRDKSSLSAPDTQAMDEEMIRRILAHVRIRTGHDFSKYKRSTVLRRLARRMQVTRTETLRDYFERLRENGEEAQALLGDLLISVTTFFRDPEAFAALKTNVLPQIFREKDPQESIRVWVPGCATGEEAYSIAILMLEEAGRQEPRSPIQVFGSDLDARALALAREGRFLAAIEADVSEERLRRYFLHDVGAYRAKQELRDILLFAHHDVLKDPPFSKVDLISCRNLLIYLDRELQEQLCGTFHYALNPGGFLFLGSSETAENPPGLFRAVDRNARIYQTTARPGDKPRVLPRLLGGTIVREPVPHLGRPHTPSSALGEAVIHRRAIERVAPPSILVDENHRVVHLSESAGRFIQPSGGPLSGDVVDLVRPEFRFELRAALHRAFEQGEATLSLPMLVRFDGLHHHVHVQVKPVTESDAANPRSAVILFIEGGALDETELPAEQRQATEDTVRRLDQELEITRTRLRTVREESEAANEELRAANEELQSMNEEYRSTSEELETSKEELQSINEELQTVNSELKLKLEAISRAHSDLQNLMAATDFATLFLDSSLRIKRFTDRVTDLFSLAANDEGRPITDFAHQLDYEELVKDARRVLSELAPVRREVGSRSGRWYDVRLRPYRTVDNKIDGVVLTFVDISDRRKVEEALRESVRQLEQQQRLVNLSRDPIFVWDFDDGILEWNRGCVELYGYERSEALGKRKEQLLRTTLPSSSFESLRQRLLDEGNWTGELEQTTKHGRKLIVESRLQLEAFEGRRLVLESTRDITEQKQWAGRQRMLLGELTHRVKNTLAIVQSIAHQTLRNASTPEEFNERFSGRLSALAAAHGLLVQSDWQGADLAALARSQLKPYIAEREDRVRIEGTPVLLPADIATPFGLVLHELATNAVKYGALSRAPGTVDLTWSVSGRNQQQALTVLWNEKAGPQVQPPKRAGFGSSLIERGIPSAKVTREFGANGLVCRIELPLPEESAKDGAAIRT